MLSENAKTQRHHQGDERRMMCIISELVRRGRTGIQHWSHAGGQIAIAQIITRSDPIEWATPPAQTVVIPGLSEDRQAQEKAPAHNQAKQEHISPPVIRPRPVRKASYATACLN